MPEIIMVNIDNLAVNSRPKELLAVGLTTWSVLGTGATGHSCSIASISSDFPG
jgi:hypothetical protein